MTDRLNSERLSQLRDQAARGDLELRDALDELNAVRKERDAQLKTIQRTIQREADVRRAVENDPGCQR